MPWFYAGPDAKPVGPIPLEELQARRRGGFVLAETYVLEWTQETGPIGTWRNYREVFPEGTGALPPLPLPAPPAPPVPPITAIGPHGLPPGAALSPPHPLFPSAGHAPQPLPAHAAAPHGHYPARRVNPWCGWGFGLGIAGFVFSFACGLGLLIAAPALLVCILGLVQIQRHPEQSGRGLAIAGGILSLLALLIAAAFLIYTVPIMFKSQQWTVTEQSSTNSE